MKYLLYALCALYTITAAAQPYTWKKLTTAPYNGGKQDGISFINPDTGWCVNGSGKIFRTNDGGLTWTNQLTQAGTYFRCVAFIDKNTGFAGNIGTDYFPGVTDPVPFYKTTDGGTTWAPVSYTGPAVKGLCAIDYVATPFINAGILDTNYTIYAMGRVGGPAYMLKSADNGNTWISKDLSSDIAMITDVKFISKDTGFVFGGTNADITASSAKILYTTDGGNTFTSVYQSARNTEMIWKGCFAGRRTGYATVLSYDATNTQRYVAKTTDGGLTWSELPLAGNSCEEFGIGFVSDTVGWLGTNGTGFQTTDGGTTWTPHSIGQYANKIQVLHTKYGFVAYAIGLNVFKTDSFSTVAVQEPATTAGKALQLQAYPNPATHTVHLQYHLDKKQIVAIAVYDMNGRRVDTVPSSVQPAGNNEVTYSFDRIASRLVYFVLQTETAQSKIVVSLQP